MEADSAKNTVEVDSRHVDVETESEIVEAARNGDIDSFGRLYERNSMAGVFDTDGAGPGRRCCAGNVRPGVSRVGSS